jgi:hypothetical protein
MEPKVVGPREYPTFILKNLGDTTISFGYPYRVQRLEEGRWRTLDNSAAFTLPLLLMGPEAKAFSQQIAVYGPNNHRTRWEPGRYRVIKRIGMGTSPGRSVGARVVFRATS